jgi:hypothetical protein
VSYEIILADPPWSYRDSANAGKRGAVHKYRTLRLPEIVRARCPRHRRAELPPGLVVGAPDARRGLGGRQGLGLYAQDDEGLHLAQARCRCIRPRPRKRVAQPLPPSGVGATEVASRLVFRPGYAGGAQVAASVGWGRAEVQRAQR